MNIRRVIKRNNLVSYLVAVLIVFLIVAGFIQIRRRPN